ncbi:hypothetical protein EPUS_03628 [Endocarpon pusillum Z07020]|uniref:RNA polymerase II subunit B1 CTD phosphatase RPAP2 homolog n=1 Tax=Endocarpon pusillum (strain Z07020 / HMAS-L-300199) TaxID=1263415 RepID=U1GD77_ENDPU|nr:uncharacterized protein EPUS_03628 [Endocarpon pusillum Z07020]ERF69636.1 hypothetical protein EPUS_03628 [Endocarpon pusillum Z07020]
MTSFLDCLKADSPSSSDNTNKVQVNDRQRSTALNYARNIQYHKSMQERVLDLIVNTVDLPSHSNADPARPLASDAALFKRALTLFQPKDYDDIILERNIYEKCGYALCPKPNLKQDRDLRDRTFRSMKQGCKFRLNTKEELDKWCSLECAERALFVRLQLRAEPAWLRSTPTEDVRLLEESGQKAATEDLVGTMQGLALEEPLDVDLATSLQSLALDQAKKNVIQDRIHALSIERDKNRSTEVASVTATGIKEKETFENPSAPSVPHHASDSVEGYQPRNLRLGQQAESKGYNDFDMNT